MDLLVERRDVASELTARLFGLRSVLM